MSFQYFSGEVRGLRGPGLTAGEAADIAEVLALAPTVALHTQKLNRYQVSFLDPITVDLTAGTVKYGRFIIGREGEAFKFVIPADYPSLGGAFTLALAPPATSEEHYLDVSMLAPAQTAASPIKKVTSGNFVEADLETVPLSLSYSGNFQPLWGGKVIYRQDERVYDTLVFDNGDPFYDENNLWGGGTRCVYLPTSAGTATSGFTGRIFDTAKTIVVATISNAESAERAGYCKLQFPASSQAEVLVVSKTTGEASIVNFASYQAAAGELLLLGVWWRSQPAFFAPVRNVADKVGPNVFPNGKTMDDGTLDVYPDPGAGASVDITSSELLAVGFTKGIRGGVNNRIAVGMGSFPATIGKTVQYVTAFVRFAAQVSVDDAFPTNGTIFLWNSISSQLEVPVPLERKLSARAAIYSRQFTIAFDDFDKFYAGLVMTGTGAYAVITGMQFSCAHQGVTGIHRQDYPVSATSGADFDIAYPPVMFLSKGRPLPFYPGNIIKNKRVDYLTTTSLSVNNLDSSYPVEYEGGSQIIVDPAKIDNAATGRIDYTMSGSPDHRYGVPITYKVGPYSGAGAVRRVHIIGDSITNRQMPIRTGQVLQSLGYAATMIGTMINFGGGTNAAPANGGEGREAREFADYIFEHTDAISPLAVGDEAAYRSGSDAYKLFINPYLREAVGGWPAPGSDNPLYVFNGYTFDFRFYLDRFGFPDPTHVIINLGRNDVSQQTTAETLAQVERGYRVMRDRIRAACPTAYIGFAKYSEALSGAALTDWDTDQWEIITKLMGLIKADVTAGDTRLFFVPSYAHMNQNTGWALTEIESNPNTGRITYSVADYIHPESVARQQCAEVYAAFVSATGVFSADNVITYDGGSASTGVV